MHLHQLFIIGDEMGDILHSLTEEFRKTITDHFSARLAALERKFESETTYNSSYRIQPCIIMHAFARCSWRWRKW